MRVLILELRIPSLAPATYCSPQMADGETIPPGHEVEADDYDGLGANPSEADGEAELEAFFELLTESFYDVDETLSGSISFEACPNSGVFNVCVLRARGLSVLLRGPRIGHELLMKLSLCLNVQDLEKIMKSLMEEELLQNYHPDDLEMLAHDMDVNEK
jgi:hypothetical protein